jgi:kinesin family protein C2/C3
MYTLDAAHWSYSSSRTGGAEYAVQSDVTLPMAGFALGSLAQRRSVCVFACGQDGTGKSHTLFGTRSAGGSEEGISGKIGRGLFRAPLAVDDDDGGGGGGGGDGGGDGGSQSRARVVVTLSAYEVVGEHVFDLGDPHGADRSLRVREDAQHRIYVEGGSAQRVRNEAAFRETIRKLTALSAARRGADTPTHIVMTVTLHRREGNEVTRTRLVLCELAGSLSESERAGATRTPGRIAANKSLATLNRCFAAMSRGAPVPYRNASLTLLLRDTFAGETRIGFLAALSPSHGAFKDTTITLDLAATVARLKINPLPHVRTAKWRMHRDSVDSDGRSVD